jgi:hypothetical protein
MLSSKQYIGCCGAYCKTCKEYTNGLCKGCKLGYENQKRDINKAKCKIKLCCFRDNDFQTCADCPNLKSCSTINSWYEKKGYKYKKYKEAILFILKNGYSKFVKKAKSWTNAYGKLK